MKFNSQKNITLFAAMIGITAISNIALAESDPMARYQEQIDTGVRYPGDVAFKEGTIRLNGPDKGPYVERCTWSLRPASGKGFGLTQSCIRHTLENTRIKN